jgi:L-ornithine Nalpha-acyltransferase
MTVLEDGFALHDHPPPEFNPLDGRKFVIDILCNYGMQENCVKVEPHFSKRIDLGVRQARSQNELRVAQRLRYRVFYEELGANADHEVLHSELDSDRYDVFCDHLLVTRARSATSRPELCVDDGEVVGTYRLLRQSVAAGNGGFYSQGEFDVGPLLERKSDLSFLELGRSCILQPYRGTHVIELLWQGIWDYVRHHKLDVMLGCASFEGTDPDAHAEALSFLGHYAIAPPEWSARAHDRHCVEMKRRPSDEINKRRALLSLPPLIKGYLRLGSYIGEGAVIDHAFNTTDVLIILPVSAINPRYFAHFGAPTS